MNDVRKDKRVALALTPDIYNRLVVLADLEGKKPAVFAREILSNYLDTRATDVADAQKAAEAYRKSLKNIRDSRNSFSLFDTDANQ